MFAVVFEVQPGPGRWDPYLGIARMLRPELEGIDGFVDNVRWRSLTREGWLLSLSSWRDEKSVVRWRVHARHHGAQEQGRNGVFADYWLRVGQFTHDTRLPEGSELREQRLEESEAGLGTTATLIDAADLPDGLDPARPEEVAAWLGLRPDADGLLAWDVFEAILTPGHVVLLLSWRGAADAERFEAASTTDGRARRRRVRIVRAYGMFDRGEAPQYYPAVERPAGR